MLCPLDLIPLRTLYRFCLVSVLFLSTVKASNNQLICAEASKANTQKTYTPFAPHIPVQSLQALIASYLPQEITKIRSHTHDDTCLTLGIGSTFYPEVSNAHYSRGQNRVNILYSCGKLLTGTVTHTDLHSLQMKEFPQYKPRTTYSLLSQCDSGTHLVLFQNSASLIAKATLILELKDGQYRETDNNIMASSIPKTLSLSPNGKYLAMSTDDIVTLRTVTPNSHIDHQVLTGECKQIHFSADGKYLIAAGYSAPQFSMKFEINIYIFIITKDKLVLKSKIVYQTYHSNFITAISFIPNREHILCGFSDGSICVWSLDGKTHIGQELAAQTTDPSFINQSVNEINYSPDQTYVATASHRKILLWRYDNGKYISCKPATIVCKEVVKSVHFIDSQHIGLCTQHGIYEIWQLPSALHDNN